MIVGIDMFSFEDMPVVDPAIQKQRQFVEVLMDFESKPEAIEARLEDCIRWGVDVDTSVENHADGLSWVISKVGMPGCSDESFIDHLLVRAKVLLSNGADCVAALKVLQSLRRDAAGHIVSGPLRDCDKFIKQFKNAFFQPVWNLNEIKEVFSKSNASYCINDEINKSFNKIVSDRQKFEAKWFYKAAVFRNNMSVLEFISGVLWPSGNKQSLVLMKSIHQLRAEAIKNNQNDLENSCYELLKMVVESDFSVSTSDDLKYKFSEELQKAYAYAGHQHFVRTLVLNVIACALGVGLLVAGFRLIRGLVDDNIRLTGEEVFLGRTSAQKDVLNVVGKRCNTNLHRSWFIVNPPKERVVSVVDEQGPRP